MQIVVLRETAPGESRVGVSPESVRKLMGMRASVAIEAGAGEAAGFPDADFVAAGAAVQGDRQALLATADVLVTVAPPDAETLAGLKAGATLVGFLDPLNNPRGLIPIAEGGHTALSMELVPRITRAQSMDALSSMATVAGYKAVLIAANRLPRMFPLLMTAAGTVPPARVLVVGAGVAGLMAIATARRLGARVSGYDVRAAAGEQVLSLGATFLEVDLGGIETEDAGGYAKELSEEALDRGRKLVAQHAAKSDVVITTAQIPGRKAPLVLLAEAVDAMAPGSVVVDLAAATGGNCPLTRPDEVILHKGVAVMGPTNLAGAVPYHASQLYGRNVTALLGLILKEGELALDFEDEIIKGCCVTRGGEIVHPRVAKMLQGGS